MFRALGSWILRSGLWGRRVSGLGFRILNQRTNYGPVFRTLPRVFGSIRCRGSVCLGSRRLGLGSRGACRVHVSRVQGLGLLAGFRV